MDQAELEITAKMIDGVVYEGGLYVRTKERVIGVCVGCSFANQSCSKFRLKADKVHPTGCSGIVWIKQNSK